MLVNPFGVQRKKVFLQRLENSLAMALQYQRTFINLEELRQVTLPSHCCHMVHKYSAMQEQSCKLSACCFFVIHPKPPTALVFGILWAETNADIWELILQHAFRPAIAQENAPGQKQRSSSSPPTFACRHLQCTDADHVGNVDLKILFLFSSFWISAFGLWILAFGFVFPLLAFCCWL